MKVGEAVPQNMGDEYPGTQSAVLRASTTTREWETRFEEDQGLPAGKLLIRNQPSDQLLCLPL